MDIPVLIPAYNPDNKLLLLINSLLKLNFKHIIIVNDGSIPECKVIFSKLELIPQCHVLHHAVNYGKGRALKTGLNYYHLNFQSTIGIVTCDADGQHKPKDILKIAKSLKNNTNKLILGTRTFEKNIPFRSLLGNVITGKIVSFLIGKKISDTQTGLRGIPTRYILEFLKLKGEQYEYEMNMLIVTKVYNIEIIEEKISTVYLKGNISSHFNPLFDSMKIYFLLIRFGFSSFFASLMDFLVFIISYKLISNNILFNIIIARVIASLINFTINRHLVFHNKNNIFLTIVKYYFLVVIIIGLTYIMINVMVNRLGLNVILSKMLSETILFIISFSIQREFIFSNKMRA